MAMRIKKWHFGKLIILWSWGGLLAALSLTLFLSGPVSASPVLHLLSFGATFAILVTLSAITWHWLSGKEEH
jgi:hypothetical protein